MPDPRLHNAVKRHRERRGLSQQALAERAGVSRQAVIAIEAGRQVPSTSLALQLALGLGCRVEDLFQLATAGGLEVRVAPGGAGARVAIGEVDGAWVAHRLSHDASVAADGVLEAGEVARPLADPAQLRRNVLVAGCAPLLGALAQRVGARFTEARITWLSATSFGALDLLASGLVHVAGLHLSGDNVAAVRRAFPGRRMLVVNLTTWRQGLVVPAGNPLGIRAAEDLLRPGLRLAARDEGAGATRLVRRLLGGDPPAGPLAAGHADVARLVRCGAADVGVAVEGVALAAGLGFVPLVEERFDLVMPAALAAVPPASLLLDALDDRGLRAEISHLPGYDGALTGQITTVEAA